MTMMLFAACFEDGYVGNEDIQGVPVAFTTSTGAATRSGELTGQDAAALLGNEFVVYATKVKADGTTIDPVFPGYQVVYANNTASTTTSNSANWDYVGMGDDQTIKYWDFAATSYTFAAYSLGTGESKPTVTASSTASQDGMPASITITGSKDQLMGCYVTNKLTKAPGAFNNHQVQLQFYNLASKVRMGIYETIPGYSVKDVKFYKADGTEATAPTLYTSGNAISTGGKITISYADDGKAKINASATTGYPATNSFALSPLTGYQAKEANESAGDYLGRKSDEAAKTDYVQMLPMVTSTDLQLKVDYTLVPVDDPDGHQITVKGATATIPAAYTAWKSNYAYTYLFKIGDNTNGHSGTSGLAGLYPITFDAYVVANDNDADQGTITTISTYSITTYQEGDADANGINYVVEKPVQVGVMDYNNGNVTKIVLSDASLNTTTDWVVIYHQATNDETIIETTTSDNTTPSDGVYLESITKIENDFAYFIPDKTGTYRIEYWHKNGDASTERRSVKVIKVGEAPVIDTDIIIDHDDDEQDNDYRKVKNKGKIEI